MRQHHGPVCRLCGTPLLSPDERDSVVCDHCWNWQLLGTDSNQAIGYASEQRRREEHDRWKQRRERKRP